MEELTTYEARIHAAFARIAASSQQIAATSATVAGGAEPGELAELQAQNDILRAEIASIKTISPATQTAAIAGEVSDLRKQVAALENLVAERSEQLSAMNAQMRNLQIANAELTDALSKLRGASEAEQVDSGDINRAMQAELEAKTQALESYEMQVNMLLAEFERLMEAENGAS